MLSLVLEELLCRGSKPLSLGTRRLHSGDGPAADPQLPHAHCSSRGPGLPPRVKPFRKLISEIKGAFVDRCLCPSYKIFHLLSC